MRYLALSTLMLFTAAFSFGQVVPADSPAKIVSAPEFTISAEDEAAGIDGTIQLDLSVDDKGNVKKASISVGPASPCFAELDQQIANVIKNAEIAAKEIKFSPAIKKGKAVSTEMLLTMDIGKTAREKKNRKQPDDDANMIKGGLLNGKALSLPKAEYPEKAKILRVTGPVSIGVVIGEDGKVLTAQVLAGHPTLKDTARNAACRATFAPTILSGKPVKVSGVITYNFGNR